MDLKQTPFIYIDCQTTGMRPPRAHLLELAWAVGSAETDTPEVRAHLVCPPEGIDISSKVSEITGIRPEHLSDALTSEDLVEPLRAAFAASEAAVIHYAQFEKPFLTALLGDIPRPCLCTYNLVKRLFPNLPRQNIRATAGFFGPPVLGLNRAGVFVTATMQIWRGLAAELERRGLKDLASVEEWLKGTKRAKATRYEYRLDKVKRLDLPPRPGVYRMLGQTGEVLYVGKATSLRDRVNSYFRGQKNRDQRKLEMLAQVWDLRVTECATPLEAALLESDEIKRLNPPYNVVLKTGRRHLVFYTREFNRASRVQDREFRHGPFRNHNWIEHLRILENSVASGRFGPIFFDDIAPETLAEAYELFLDLHELPALTSVRQFLAVGARLHRAHAAAAASDEVEEVDAAQSSEESDEEHVFTVEEVAGKFERLFRRAGAEWARARQLTRLLDARVRLGERTLEFRRGRLLVESGSESAGDTAAAPLTHPDLPWADLDVDAFDRMSILRTAVEFSGAVLTSSELG